jgi:peroxiredoxin
MNQQRSLRWVAYLLSIGLVGLVIILSLEVRSPRGYQQQVQRMKAFPHVGQWLPTIRVPTLSGDSLVLGETTPGRAQILIAFSTSCEFCLATLPRWKVLTDSLSRDPRGRFDVIWISASSWDSTKAYALRHSLTGAIAKFSTAKLARVYQVKTVPLTIIVDRWGRVEYMHSSLFRTSAAFDSIFSAAYRAAAADSIWAAVATTPGNTR